MDRFDALVVGAGPAGAVTALVLARAGARVCLVDRAGFPRPKLCGDSLNPGALAVLQRLGLSEPIVRRALRVEGMLVSGPGVAVEGRYPDGLHGLAIRRDDLDLILVEAAVRAGADFRAGVRAAGPIVRDGRAGTAVVGASCTGPGGMRFDIEAHVTVAADGRRSALALALGLTRHPPGPRRWAIGVHAAGVRGLTSFGEMHIRRNHYIGIAPLPGGLANLCVVRPVDSAEAAFREPAATLRGLIEREPMLRDRVAGAVHVSRALVLGPLAVEAVPGARAPRGLLLAGDAAGFIDPMTGDGLRFALRGGELAAPAALRALEQGWDGVHAALDAARAREFGGKWRFNRLLRALVASPAGVRGATVGAKAAPAVIRALIRHASDCGLAAAT
ncbi:MAG: NAD(P)/FAD-dependent oxidoreductase [Vicinamibacterales bacterium]